MMYNWISLLLEDVLKKLKILEEYNKHNKNTIHLPRQEFNKRLKILILWCVWKSKRVFY